MKKTLYDVSMIETDVMKMLVTVEMSKKTKDNYEHYLQLFFGWWFENHSGTDPKTASPTDAMTWLNTHPLWVSSTRYAAGAAIKKFYKWEYGDGHQMLVLKIKRVDPGPQRTLDQDELLDVLASIDTTTTVGIRDLAILSIMVDTGIRASEVCNLELDNLNFDKRKFIVTVKGGYKAEKNFFDYSAICLQNWLFVRNQCAVKGTKEVFVSVGEKKPGTKMTVSGLRYLSEKMSKLSGISKFSPHSLRRTFATLATENGAPSRVVQLAGGWKSIRMVERYTRALKPEAIKPYSPIDKLMKI
jgi:integrase/recombinase XerC